jgi:hypothetical protein
MQGIVMKSSFDYPYMQALLKPSETDNYSDLEQLTNVLSVAFSNRSSKGCLEAFIDVLRRALHLSIDLRYTEGIIDEKKEALQQAVLQYLANERKQVFKLILGANTQAATKQTLSKQEKELVDFVDITNVQDEEDARLSPDLIDSNISASLAR